eukprot:1188279-Prorocentrum_minimum.AAC.6
MPYFDGDYWPGSADDLLANIEANGLTRGGQQGKNKGQTSKSKKGQATKGQGRGTKQSGSPGVGTSKLEPFDASLMEQLGEVLGGLMKEDFIIAHLHHCCTHCGSYIHGGRRYFAEDPTLHIEICEPCYHKDQQRGVYERIQVPLRVRSPSLP